jgi:hypothetical protein
VTTATLSRALDGLTGRFSFGLTMITPVAFTATPANTLQSDEWIGELDTNAHGVRLLTLRRAFELASSGCCAGWYIAPFALKWTVGRMARTGQRFHVISDGEPISFESVADAFQFLSAILRLAAAPQLSLDCSGLTFHAARA